MFSSISRVLVLASLATPLLVFRSMYFPFISVKAIFFRSIIELALLCYGLHLIFAKDRAQLFKAAWQRLRQPLVLSAFAFTALYVITALLGENPTQSFWSNFERGEGAFQLLHYFFFFALIVVLFPTRALLNRLLITHIGVSVLVSLYALGQLVTEAAATNFFIAAGGRVSGTLGNPSYLAAYLLITFAILGYFFLQTKKLEWRLTLGVIALFELFILIKTGTRGAFVALVIGIILLLCINLFTTKRKKVRLTLGMTLIGILLLGGSFLLTRNAPVWTSVPVFGRVLDFQSVENGFQPRIWTWSSALSGFLERPIAGWGAENFAYAFDKYYNPNHFGRESFFDRTHNVALEHLVSGGLILFAAWLALLYSYFSAVRRYPKNVWFSVLITVPVVYLIQGFFLFDVLPIFLALYLFFALALTPNDEKAPVIPSAYVPRVANYTLAIGLTALIATNLFYSSIQPLKKNYLVAQAIIKENQGDPIATIETYQQALDLSSPVGQEETVSAFIKYSMTVAEQVDMHPVLSNDPSAKQLVTALVTESNALFEEHQNIMPGLKNTYLVGAMNIRAAIAFPSNGEPVIINAEFLERGKKIYQDAIALAPTRVEFIKVLLEVAKIEKDAATAKSLLKRLTLLRPDINWES